MRSFLKVFFASLLALIVFSVIAFFFTVGWIGGLASARHETVGGRAVLTIDLAQAFHEKQTENPLARLNEGAGEAPGLYDLVRLIAYAKTDSSVKGIFLKCEDSQNGAGTSEEIRNALLDFRKSGKFVIAAGSAISGRAYYVASAADRIYVNPKGGVEWRGYSIINPYLKTGLDKLNVEPQIFYAGRYKSATEPLRSDHMSDADREQNLSLLNDLFTDRIVNIAAARNLDTVLLRRITDDQSVRTAADALRYKLVDGLKYEDEVNAEIASRLRIDSTSSINFLPVSKYASAVGDNYKRSGKDRIALIYAEGEIVDGKSDQGVIGEDVYRPLIRKARLDKSIKAIVLRINSGGGNGMVSENLWRELTLARKDKPVVVSFGDVSASGAYYISCNADSVFAEPNCITGSIGVFSMLFNFEPFFRNKLGVTFDGVHTAKQPDAITAVQPLTDFQKQFLQRSVDSFYLTFKTRVADGRKKDIGYVDSIAQGRIWSGNRALSLGLIDRVGSVQDAIDCAARMAKTNDYGLREYPEPKTWVELLLNNYRSETAESAISDQLGSEGLRMYREFLSLREQSGTLQTRLPYGFEIR